MKRNIVALLLCLLSVTAFSQEDKQKDQYLGLDKNVVIEKLGQPTITKKATDDGETLVYIFRKTNKTESALVQDKSSIKEAKMHMYTFTLDKNGKVINWEDSYPQSK